MTDAAALAGLNPDRTALVVVDVQEAFRKSIDGYDRVIARSVRMVRGAIALGMPVVVTEQLPDKLGATVSELQDVLPDGTERLPKSAFSATRAQGFHLKGRDQVVVVGIEAHVCVQGTCLDLLRQGLAVHVAGDAAGSRTAEDREAGLTRVARAGAMVGTTESILLELLGDARADSFKTILELIR
ncbi:isochorismatase family protein [Patulibacter sp.]|uniref:isochorismatase family protein n=1 Tax=Patulibacter sp. TaxID=1912859 RepID=UPI0027223BDF|nr:isochorismatase family protein [Patulibacter sp.]MDO9408575.1 isochorismatase family protein [Patulibacter sp.]